MYMLRLPNSVYYTRVVTPNSLRALGYPKEIKLSLFTRNRKTATLRNIDHTKVIFTLFELAEDKALVYAEFKLKLAQGINALRELYNGKSESTAVCTPLGAVDKPKATSDKEMINKVVLARFIESKKLEKITQLTIKQLEQRCSNFLTFMQDKKVAEPTNSLAMDYRDELLKRKLSRKTIKDYLAAIKQFLNWCMAHDIINANPFNVVKLPAVTGKGSISRKRWQVKDLQRFMQSSMYREQGEQFDWITKISLYHGTRPSEACQLYTADIKLSDLPCIHFSDAGKNQHLKNQSSNRVIPIHKALIESSFLEYVAKRKQQRKKTLFDLTPRGDDLDWSKDYRDVFGDVLDKCGFKAGDRATAYSLRHTFIDELKKKGIEEHVVAQIVGQKHQNLTYGHYGKLLSPEELVSSINAFEILV